MERKDNDSRTNIRTVVTPQGELNYELTRKQVKNVNLRVDREGRIKVSAHPGVPVSFIEDFILQKESFIRRAVLARQKQQEESRSGGLQREKRKPSREELIREKELAGILLADSMERMSRLVAPYGIRCREMQIRRMSSRWGSCIPSKGKITLNSRLIEAPKEAVDYVVLHELAHMKYPHHQKSFYEFIARFMPDWKERRNMLKQVSSP